MYDRLKAMWRPEGKMRMVDLDHDVFLVSFDNPQDYDHALTGGPWMILDHYLVCHGWDPSFRVSANLPSRMVVWIRFPKLPYQYYQEAILKGWEISLGELFVSTNVLLPLQEGNSLDLLLKSISEKLWRPVSSSTMFRNTWNMRIYPLFISNVVVSDMKRLIALKMRRLLILLILKPTRQP
ncbi:hypothetical protein LINGRAHAP2_LOCUS27927 [Linum grandiflorum]